MDPSRIIDSFPAPSFRGNQEQALRDIRDAFADGNDVVLVRAPTGSGKSLLARSIAGAAATVEETSPAEATDAYYTTPQVSQLDDVAEDALLSDLKIIRGKSNYNCIIRGEKDTPVDRAPCTRKRGFDCSVRHRCPYFSDRAIASNRQIAAMTLAYFMQTAGSDVFRKRDVVVIDEAHGLAEWAEMYATIDLKPRTVPIWDDIGVPDLSDAGDPIERAVRFADTLVGVCKRAKDELLTKSELLPEEAAKRDRLQELIGELKWFVDDYRDPQSPTTWVVDQHDGEGSPIAIKPLDPAKYLKHTVWDRGNKFALLSATILNKAAFCRSVGLDPSKVALVDVGHTFPVENRPLYNVTQGKMTYEHRDETLPNIARLVVRLMAKHPDEKGLVHCHSYAIQAELRRRLAEMGLGNRIHGHDRNNRNAELETWKATDRPEVFLSVKMEEALDLKGDLCRWQVLCKAPYLNTNDSRVARRLEDGQWAWYRRAALRTVIQACGRVVRAPDDYGDTYIADSSLLQLFEKTRTDMPGWFEEQVDRMSKPDLPEFDPVAAGGRGSNASGGDTPFGSGSAGRSGSQSQSSGRSTRTSGTTANRSTGSTGSSGGQTGGSNRSSDNGSNDGGRGDHPLSDVWGE
ncbi:ATP-dependent DNA helicase [Haloferax mediterranei ATCC 33500]|uniref:Helicase n=1 Tax=Haloferax mediterranei (strain ATCC 33500 / DSM 1411 / JCM 8866 / NBRC 14739 / NCIMB 2177 / R-4) TaxID=523841 RepID=I3R0T9_HALMT|nr:ATP-dependent DNA helicase [Haloferax mediterranei]AFK17849.1 Rad3-related DNA helicases DinG [Haloferax mediterranei ATCC 33500]AHZ22728.1 helicase [Haloferax mediterranei ATCC 33500]EMA02878.1 Rad3-related DNA helicases DinG [Haloferax mediterranei ATCC 33500]MDX5987937.1 ATP-dependent DNA helicase [Haloferax mediterranei ATCC 33500]QCQ74407.1 ATP-dependent DNA helicase [Haloferax mediterranei ATCC 33500]